MKLIFILGSQAVGKMTVGQELTKITDLKLMHNHLMIEPVLEVFGEFKANVIFELRDVIFKNFLYSNNYGLIFTMCFDFDSLFNWDYINEIVRMYEEEGAEIYYVELVANKEIRLERNKSENRLEHKKSKRDIALSEDRIINENLFHRYESFDGEIPWDNYMKIDNSNLSPVEVAKLIKDKFDL